MNDIEVMNYISSTCNICIAFVLISKLVTVPIIPVFGRGNITDAQHYSSSEIVIPDLCQDSDIEFGGSCVSAAPQIESENNVSHSVIMLVSFISVGVGSIVFVISLIVTILLAIMKKQSWKSAMYITLGAAAVVVLAIFGVGASSVITNIEPTL